jgi:hypothetical protein
MPTWVGFVWGILLGFAIAAWWIEQSYRAGLPVAVQKDPRFISNNALAIARQPPSRRCQLLHRPTDHQDWPKQGRLHLYSNQPPSLLQPELETQSSKQLRIRRRGYNRRPLATIIISKFKQGSL